LTPLVSLMVALTAARLAVAAILPLAPDETYYWVWSHALAAGYLDHPPMVAFWIRIGTLLAGQSALGVRLLGPLSAALASWFLFDAAQFLFPGRRAGSAAVLLLNGSLLLGVGSVIMTPDAPLIFFWTATLWAMVRLIDSGSGVWWLAAGLFGGLALDSKYTALFLWVGVGLWVLLVPAARPWLRRWEPWAAVVLGTALFAPVLIWNAAHGWVGFARQGGRVGDWQPMRAVGFLAELFGGQIGLATPWIFILCMTGLVVAARRTWTRREPRWSLLAALSVPPVLVFVQHALGDRVQGNWPAIIYPAAVLAAAGLVRPDRNTAWIGASALGFGVTAVVYVQATTGLIPLPPRLDPIAMRLAGWDGLARQVEAMRQQAGANYVAVEGYGAASELAWWLPSDVPVVGVDDHWALTNLPPTRIAGTPGLLLRDARRTDPPDRRIWTQSEALGPATRPGSSTTFAQYLVVASAQPAVAVNLPHRR
jgi:4-amino-4-deoxy-L-arabinose transferase-like glycosyltransferase